MSSLPAPPHPEKVPGDSWLYRLALQVERDERLMAELAEWEAATIADGLDDCECPGEPGHAGIRSGPTSADIRPIPGLGRGRP